MSPKVEGRADGHSLRNVHHLTHLVVREMTKARIEEREDGAKFVSLKCLASELARTHPEADVAA